MKKIILSCVAVLAVSLFSTVVFASPTLAISIAKKHLEKQGYKSTGAIYLEQTTEKSYVIMKEYVVGNPDTEYPCHALIAVDKKTNAINMRNNDPEINLDFDYADTYPQLNKKMYLVCAD